MKGQPQYQPVLTQEPPAYFNPNAPSPVQPQYHPQQPYQHPQYSAAQVNYRQDIEQQAMPEGDSFPIGLILFIVGWLGLGPIAWIIGGCCLPIATRNEMLWQKVNAIFAWISLIPLIVFFIAMIVIAAMGVSV